MATLALICALGYGTVRVYWQIEPPPDLSPIGPDLVFTGWWGIALCASTAALAMAMLRVEPSGPAGPPILIASAATSIGLLAAAAMFVLDLVGGIFPGLGIDFFPGGAASRLVCIVTGVLLALAARDFYRRTGLAWLHSDRLVTLTAPLAHTPRWAFVAAYVSVAACLTRVMAQAVVGFDHSPLSGAISKAMFELCFILAGTLLPLALAHSWGMVWPRWVLGLSGRKVPRWLVLGPGIATASLVTVYFGLMLVQMIVERAQGRNPFPPDARMDLPESFFWVAVPAYLIWGVSLAIAALSYYRRTRVGHR